MLKKDKEKILDEVWTIDRVKDFLNIQPPEGVNADFHALSSAYTSMRLENFEEFLDFFAASKRDFSATNEAGETVATIISQHRKGAHYLEAIKKVS